MGHGYTGSVTYLPRLVQNWGIKELKLLVSAGVIPEVFHVCRGINFKGPVTSHRMFRQYGYLFIAIREGGIWHLEMLVDSPGGLRVV